MSEENGKFQDFDKELLSDNIYSALRNCRFGEAEMYSKKLIELDPHCGEAYLAMLLCSFRVSSKEELALLDEPLDSNASYEKLLLYAEENLAEEIKGYGHSIKDNIYTDAHEIMDSAETEEDFYQAAQLFDKILNFKDSQQLAQKCKKEREFLHNERIYNSAVDRLRYAETWAPSETTIQAYEASVAELKTIPDWKDAKERIATYQARLFDLRVAADKNRGVREEKAKHRKKSQRIRLAVTASSIAVLAAVIAVTVYCFTSSTQYHTFEIKINPDDYESQYIQLAEFENFEPVKQILKKFIWLPSTSVTSSNGSFLSTKMDFQYSIQPDHAESTITSHLSIGQANADSKWLKLEMDAGSSYSYDSDGNLTVESLYVGDNVTTTEYSYNEDGLCIEECRTDKKGRTTTTHIYNSDGTRKSSVSIDKKNRASEHIYTYDENKNIVQERITLPGGDATVIDYTYDEYGNCLKKITADADGTMETVEYLDYEVYYIGAE